MATIERLRRSSRESIALVKQVVDEGLDEAKKKWEAVVSGRDSSRDSGTSAEAEEQKHELSDSGVAFPAVHPARSLPLPEAWPNRPLLLRRSAVAHGSASGDGENGTPQSSLQSQPKQLRHHTAAPPQPQPQPQPRPHSYPHSYPELGVPFPVETELFEGHALLRTRSTPGCEAYFAGKARRTSFVVSGRFKRPLSFAQLYTGQVAPTLTALARLRPRTHTLTRPLYLYPDLRFCERCTARRSSSGRSTLT